MYNRFSNHAWVDVDSDDEEGGGKPHPHTHPGEPNRPYREARQKRRREGESQTEAKVTEVAPYTHPRWQTTV